MKKGVGVISQGNFWQSENALGRSPRRFLLFHYSAWLAISSVMHWVSLAASLSVRVKRKLSQ